MLKLLGKTILLLVIASGVSSYFSFNNGGHFTDFEFLKYFGFFCVVYIFLPPVLKGLFGIQVVEVSETSENEPTIYSDD